MDQCNRCQIKEDESRIINSEKFDMMLCQNCYTKTMREYKRKCKIVCDECEKEGKGMQTISRKNKFNQILCADCYKNKVAKELDKQNIVCKVCGISPLEKEFRWNTALDGYLCIKHNDQYHTYGKILKRTKYDPNEIVKHRGYAEVILYNSRNEEKDRTKIDIEDIKRVKKYKWHLNNNGYVYTDSEKGDRISLHRYLIDTPEGKDTDHINRDKLDNRKSNLRICTRQENNFNRDLNKNNTSGFAGVRYNEKVSKWKANIMIDYKDVNLGYFDSKEEAIKARLEAEKEHFPEFSRQLNEQSYNLLS